MAGKPPRDEKPTVPMPVPRKPGPNGSSDFEPTNAGAPRSPSVSDVIKLTGHSARSLPQVGDKKPTGELRAPLKPGGQPMRTRSGADLEKTAPILVASPALRKQLMSSGFDDDERTHTEAVLGNARSVELDDDEESNTSTNAIFDGENPAMEVTATEAWKAVTAPVQNKPGRRSADAYGMVLDQFAVGHNARYEPDGPGRQRGHIFVWDVTRAMACEVPHFAGGREMSLLQTVDWLRREAPVRGWKKVDGARAAAFANEGLPVLAVPRDIKLRQLGVVRPGGMGPDGHPVVAAAGAQRGNSLSAMDALGTPLIDYFVHD